MKRSIEKIKNIEKANKLTEQRQNSEKAYINEMLATSPVELSKISSEHSDMEILRLAIIGELDAVSLYEQLAAKSSNKKIKETLLDIAKEEKTHVGELQALLIEIDPEHGKELAAGKKEVEK